MIIEKVFPSGAWRIADFAGDYLFSRVYYGYTKREAMREFRADFKAAIKREAV